MSQDAFRLGYRVGIVANSDGHKGRPGASYPGAALFGAVGGLTCFLIDSLSRETILEAIRKRHPPAARNCRTANTSVASTFFPANFPPENVAKHDNF